MLLLINDLVSAIVRVPLGSTGDEGVKKEGDPPYLPE